MNRLINTMLVFLFIIFVACSQSTTSDKKDNGDDEEIAEVFTEKSGDFLNDIIATFDKRIDMATFSIIENCDDGAVETRNNFKTLINKLYQNDTSGTNTLAQSLNYNITKYTDTSNNNAVYYLLTENTSNSKGQALVVINLNAAKNLVIEAPHPLFEKYTDSIASQIFRDTNSKVLIIAGSRRCNSDEISPCSTEDSPTGCGEPYNYRISDVAHHYCNLFQTTHEVLSDIDNKLVLIQIHGFTKEDDRPDMVVSDGVTHASTPSSNLIKFASKIKEKLASSKITSCQIETTLNGVEAYDKLCAASNLQGRYTNKSADICDEQAVSSSDRFISLEISLDLREKNISEIISAINQSL